MSPRVVEQSSDVAAPIDAVWARVVSPEGINDEMRPWMTMSMPRGTEDLTIDSIELGVPLGRAWIRLFGLLPIDYDHLSIVALEPGRSFHEKSTMLSMRAWQHERTLSAVTDVLTRVHDRITFEPRWFMRPSAGLFGRVLAAFFAHRHRRLARHFAWVATMDVDVLTEIVIDRPVAEVATFAGDPTNAPRWYVNIDSVEWLTPPPLAVGSRLAFEARFLGRRLAYTYEIVELVPGDRLTMRTDESPFPMDTSYRWEDTDGRTRMTLRNRGRPSGFARLGAPAMSAAMRRANRKDLQALKTLLEA